MLNYADYLKTSDWKLRSRSIKEEWGFTCAICNHGGRLDLHHRTYEHLGHEHFTDVIPLCIECHKKFHEIEEETFVCPACEKVKPISQKAKSPFPDIEFFECKKCWERH